MLERKGLMVFLVFTFCLAGVFAENIQSDSVFIKVSLEKGNVLDKNLVLSSRVPGDFRVAVFGLEGVNLDRDRFYLDYSESKVIGVSFDSLNVPVGTNVGSIKIVGLEETHSIPVIFEVESSNLFFDLDLEIPSNYGKVFSTGEVFTNLRIFDLVSFRGETGTDPVNLDVEYLVYDLGGKVIYSEMEEIVLDGDARIGKTLTLPAGTSAGDYVISAKIAHNGLTGVSSEILGIQPTLAERIIASPRFSFMIAVILVGFIYLLFLAFRKYVKGFRKPKMRYRYRNLHPEEGVFIKKSLRKKHRALKKAYEGGYIGEGSFLKGKRKIRSMSNKVADKYFK